MGRRGGRSDGQRAQGSCGLGGCYWEANSSYLETETPSYVRRLTDCGKRRNSRAVFVISIDAFLGETTPLHGKVLVVSTAAAAALQRHTRRLRAARSRALRGARSARRSAQATEPSPAISLCRGRAARRERGLTTVLRFSILGWLWSFNLGQATAGL
jgi:hypothetical protein